MAKKIDASGKPVKQGEYAGDSTVAPQATETVRWDLSQSSLLYTGTTKGRVCTFRQANVTVNEKVAWGDGNLANVAGKGKSTADGKSKQQYQQVDSLYFLLLILVYCYNSLHGEVEVWSFLAYDSRTGINIVTSLHEANPHSTLMRSSFFQ